MTVNIPAEIQQWIDVKSSFVDYKKFQGDEDARKLSREKFARGEVEFPEYLYPELENLYATDSFMSKLEQTSEAARNLLLAGHAYKEQGDIPLWAVCSLEGGRHIRNLNKMELVRGAECLLRTGDPQRFVQYNRLLHGVVAPELFQIALQPETIFNDQLMNQLNGLVYNRWGDALAVAPETDDEVVYNAQQIVYVLNEAMMVLNYHAAGYAAEISEAHSTIATNHGKKRVFVPPSRQMTAAALRGRIVHELVIHVGRGISGKETGYKSLESGTADYLEKEEGLAVLLECGASGSWENEGIDRARKRYIAAGLIAGIDRKEALPRDGRETFEDLLSVYSFSEAEALTHLDNAFRGTDWKQPGVFYSKLQIYFAGLVNNVSFLARADNLEQAIDFALIGKFDHTGEEANIVKNLFDTAPV